LDLPALALRLILGYQASNSGLGQGFGFRISCFVFPVYPG